MMRIFLSFSGKQGRLLAELLKDFLERIFDTSIDTYMSSEEPGGREWAQAIPVQLREADLGICCLTRDSQDSTWIHFESGCLYRGKKSSKASTYLIPYVCGFPDKELRGPLSSLVNPLAADETGTLKLVSTINGQLTRAISKTILEDRFKSLWIAYNSKIKLLSSPFFKKSNSTRLAECETRVQKVRAYNDTLHAEVDGVRSNGGEINRETAYLHDTVMNNIKGGTGYEYILARRPWNHRFEQWAELISQQIVQFRRFVLSRVGEQGLDLVTLSLLFCEPPIPHISVDIYDLQAGGNAGFWCVDGPSINKPDNVFEVLDPKHLMTLWSDLQAVVSQFSIKRTLREFGDESPPILEGLLAGRRTFSIDDQNWQNSSTKVNFSILSRIIAEL